MSTMKIINDAGVTIFEYDFTTPPASKRIPELAEDLSERVAALTMVSTMTGMLPRDVQSIVADGLELMLKHVEAKTPKFGVMASTSGGPKAGETPPKTADAGTSPEGKRRIVRRVGS